MESIIKGNSLAPPNYDKIKQARNFSPSVSTVEKKIAKDTESKNIYKKMIIRATFDGANFVPDKSSNLASGTEFELVVYPYTNEDTINESYAALTRLEKMRKHIPDFDYKEELNEYREERYGLANIGRHQCID